jgi:hypothetical protein
VVRSVVATDVSVCADHEAEAIDPSPEEHPMNGFQHLPEYQSAARSYRLERTVVRRRAPRVGSGRTLRARLGALLRRPVPVVPVTR